MSSGEPSPLDSGPDRVGEGELASPEPVAGGSEPFEGSEVIERLRRSGIRIDREGRFIHEGEEVQHLGLRQALFRWLDRLPPPDGRHVLRLDPQRYAYVDVDDTPLVVRSARLDGDRVLLALSDGNEEPLDPDTLTVDGAGVLRCRVREGRLEARLATSASAALAEAIREEQGRAVLVLGARRFPLPRRPESSR